MDNQAKVEQFVLLAKTAKGLALVDLIGKATAEPGLFTYGELLSLPSVQEARHNPERSRVPSRLPCTAVHVPACNGFDPPSSGCAASRQ